LICSLVVLCLLLSVPSLAEKYRTDPDSVKLYSKDAESPYQVLGVVIASPTSKDSAEAAQSMLKEFKKEAAKMGAEAVIYTEVTSASTDKMMALEAFLFSGSTPSASTDEMKAKDNMVAAETLQVSGSTATDAFIWGVAVRMLDSAGVAAWEMSHPKTPYDKEAPIEIFKGDVDRCYRVKGVAYGYARGSHEEVSDGYLRESARSKHAHAVVFCKRYQSDGLEVMPGIALQSQTALGVAVRYVK
jgi:hypothetical protein